VNIQAKEGVILCTGGHTSNMEFRRMFDPRLTEEYQVAGEPWTMQNADGEMLAMGRGAPKAQAAEIDVLSGGRLRLGIGLGWNYVEYDALGEKFQTRGRRVEEQADVSALSRHLGGFAQT
jgi:hypothetical protein